MMKKFNKTPKKTAMAIAESIADNSNGPQQSLLEKELVKKIPRKPIANPPVRTPTTTNQSSVIVNYENNRKFNHQASSQQQQSTQLILQNNENSSNDNIVDEIKSEYPIENVNNGNMTDPLATHVKEEVSNAEYETSPTFNGEDRVEQNSNSPIMLTTMQPVPIDQQMNAVPSEHPVQQDFLPGNTEEHNGEMMLQDHTHIYQTVQQPFNPDQEPLVNDLSNGDLSREVSQLREANQIIRNSVQATSTVGSQDLSQEARETILTKRPIDNTEYLSQNNISGQLQEQIQDQTQSQKTVIYLQSTLNENGQQTFIYDPSLQTQHIPTEIVSGLLQNSGLVAGGTGLVNLQDGSGGTTVLVLQEMPPDMATGGLASTGNPSGVTATSGVVTSGGIVSSVDGNGVQLDGMTSDPLTAAAGGMATLSNVAASAMKIPTIVR